jgi:hypothetical protein
LATASPSNLSPTQMLSVVALGIVATGVAALITYLAPRATDPHPVPNDWSGLAVLRILVAPLFAMGLLLAGIFAPNRTSRITLCAATVIEAAIFAYVALIWFHPR